MLAGIVSVLVGIVSVLVSIVSVLVSIVSVLVGIVSVLVSVVSVLVGIVSVLISIDEPALAGPCRLKQQDRLVQTKDQVVKMSWLTPGLLSHLRTVSGMNQPWQSFTSCSGKTDQPTLSLATRTPGTVCRVTLQNNLSELVRQAVYLEHWSVHTGLATFYQVS